jgi:uncharacterized protein (TIGR03435 family)
MTRAILLSILTAASALAQSTPPPAFEVAEIKPSPTKDIMPGKGRFLPGGRIEIPHATLKELMIGAYVVQPNMITGGPAWLDTDRFDIVAKAPDPNTPLPTLMQMMRTLLEERFLLKTHREEKEMPAYTLSVAKGGPKLHPAANPAERQNCNTRLIDSAGTRVLRRECRNMTMAEFAGQLGLGGYGLDRQVIDATELTGAYDLEFDYVPTGLGRGGDNPGGDRPAADAPAGPTIFEAMTHLGLRLEPGKRPLSVIVIDSARKPEAN